MQTEELSYAIITPYTMRKSRTGGIIARLISRTGLDLVAARMFAPGRELVEQYAQIVVSPKDPQDRKIQELIRQYMVEVRWIDDEIVEVAQQQGTGGGRRGPSR